MISSTFCNFANCNTFTFLVFWSFWSFGLLVSWDRNLWELFERGSLAFCPHSFLAFCPFLPSYELIWGPVRIIQVYWCHCCTGLGLKIDISGSQCIFSYYLAIQILIIPWLLLYNTQWQREVGLETEVSRLFFSFLFWYTTIVTELFPMMMTMSTLSKVLYYNFLVGILDGGLNICRGSFK